MYRECIEKGLIDCERCPCCKCPASVDSIQPDPVIDLLVSHYRTLIVAGQNGQDELQVFCFAPSSYVVKSAPHSIKARAGI